VIEAAVVGEADAEWGEVVVAHVVTDGELPEAELDRHCLDRIARFKRPKRYHFHAQLPKNANGKIVKRALKGA
jgi:long-chain acyl-CoA synthetase